MHKIQFWNWSWNHSFDNLKCKWDFLFLCSRIKRCYKLTQNILRYPKTCVGKLWISTLRTIACGAFPELFVDFWWDSKSNMIKIAQKVFAKVFKQFQIAVFSLEITCKAPENVRWIGLFECLRVLDTRSFSELFVCCVVEYIACEWKSYEVFQFWTLHDDISMKKLRKSSAINCVQSTFRE